MKKIMPLLMLSTLTVLSCKKSPVFNVVTPPPTHKDTLSAQVNGVTFVAPKVTAILSHYYSADYLAIIATGVFEIDLSIDNYDGVKTSFDLSDYPSTYGTINYSKSKSGQFNIVSFDKITYKPDELIAGTFQFETDDPLGKFSITNGQFSILVKHR